MADTPCVWVQLPVLCICTHAACGVQSFVDSNDCFVCDNSHEGGWGSNQLRFMLAMTLCAADFSSARTLHVSS